MDGVRVKDLCGQQCLTQMGKINIIGPFFINWIVGVPTNNIKQILEVSLLSNDFKQNCQWTFAWNFASLRVLIDLVIPSTFQHFCNIYKYFYANCSALSGVNERQQSIFIFSW